MSDQIHSVFKYKEIQEGNLGARKAIKYRQEMLGQVTEDIIRLITDESEKTQKLQGITAWTIWQNEYDGCTKETEEQC